MNGCNRNGIGSIVSINPAVGPAQWRVIEGGSRSGSQSPSQASFGVNEDSFPLDYRVVWPNGGESEGTVTGLPTEPVLVPDSWNEADIGIHNIEVRTQILPGDLQNVEFRWETNLRSDSGADLVILENPRSLPAGCQLGGVEFSRETPGVNYEMTRSGDGTFYHSLELNNVPCSIGCEIEYRVQCGIGDLVQISDVQIFSHDTCGKSFPTPQP